MRVEFSNVYRRIKANSANTGTVLQIPKDDEPVLRGREKVATSDTPTADIKA